MRYLRKRSLQKTISVFLLITFLQSVVSPYYSFALTSGPHQLEYASYEEPGATDMVNLLTGDFTMSIPVLTVPGPEGSFSLPLTYNAGISPEQEASWVGLGWTINAGAITRNVFGFPDDASGELNKVQVQDLEGVFGAEVNTYLIGRAGVNNVEGHYGAVNLFDVANLSWSNGGVTNVGLMGVNRARGGDMSFSPVQFMGAVSSLMTLGSLTSSIKLAQTAAVSGTKEVASKAMIKAVGQGTHFLGSKILGEVASESMASGMSAPAAMTASGYWQYSKFQKRFLFAKFYRTWLDQTRFEEMYGTLYSHHAPLINAPSPDPSWNVVPSLEISNSNAPLRQFPRSANNKGAASDIFFNSSTNYLDASGPAILATDNFRVKAAGISGSIKPYRLETAAVAMPRDMTSHHDRLVPAAFENYKVPFIYDGHPANSYFHHSGGESQVNAPSFHYSYSNVLGSTTPETNTSLKFDFNDISIGSERIKQQVVNDGYKLAQANHIEWLSNGTIAATPKSFSSGFMDYFAGTERSAFRGVFSFGDNRVFVSSSLNFTDGVIPLSASELQYFAEGQVVPIEITAYNTQEDFEKSGGGGTIYAESALISDKSSSSITVSLSSSVVSAINGKYCNIAVTSNSKPKGNESIGGFSITSAEGLTYHFALPVYDYDNRTYVQDKTNASKNSTIERKDPFANTWLLTGITGPDFIDRGGPENDGNGIIDAGDWGHWIKFNYGKYSDNYHFRTPYSGFLLDATNQNKSYSEGKTQLYYLNSIETRSHVALLLKKVRADNQGFNGATTLRLDEIALISREHYQKLTQPVSEEGFNMASCSGSITKCLMTSDFYSTSGPHPPQGDFLIRNAAKRIKFTYSYTLCPGVPNSTESAKLTLDRVSVLGRNDLKIIPDYVFEYANNFNYGVDEWDGWGMYAPGNSQTSRPVSDIDSHAAAWSLGKITTPIGSEININLERDTYSSVSGENLLGTTSNYFAYYEDDVDAETDLFDNTIEPESFNGLIPDARVVISGTISYKCDPAMPEIHETYETESVISSVTNGKLKLSGYPYYTIPCLHQGDIVANVGTITPVVNKKGGDLRVHSIIVTNEFGEQNKIRYLYNDELGYSTGVVAQEPDFIKTQSFPFYDLPGYPSTPVMYGKVTILNGKLTNDSDFHTQTTYEFETPHKDMMVNSRNVYKNKQLIFARHQEVGPEINDIDINHRDYVTEVRNTIEDRTSEIGRLKSIRVSDRNGIIKMSTELEYTSELRNPGDVNNYQGIYSEGTLMFDKIFEFEQTGLTETWSRRYYKTMRTTTLTYPSSLKTVRNFRDGFLSVSENNAWDFISGGVLEKTETSQLGVRIQTVNKPAYIYYPEMGSKATNVNNRNMLFQNAASYVYMLDPAGNRLGLVSATAQEWRQDWSNYRYYNGTDYVETPEEPVSQSRRVWRKGPSYVWSGDYSRLHQPADKQAGYQTFSSSDEFNFAASASNPGWQYTGEVLRFDHFGMPLESKDMNNIHSATKVGYGDRIVIASATNAKFNEIAFSSAEDLSEDKPFFGGEVALGSGEVKYLTKAPLATSSHTGESVVSLSSGYSFIFKTDNLEPNKRYRASVWTNNTNGRIYYKINGASESSSSIPQNAVNGWYKIELEIPVQTSSFSLEVGVKSVGGEVHFDDFRFQPVDAAMICYVYPPSDFEFSASGSANYSTYVLDNQNMYMKYEHNARGQLIKTFRESSAHGVKLISESRDNYRRFHVNQ